LWVPEGIQGVRAGGGTFPAEATLSRFELDGQPHFTIILRNIDERRAAEERIASLLSEAEDLRAQIDSLQEPGEIIGSSKTVTRVLKDVDKVAKGDTSVLITGETGTGKELIARALHRRSSRSSKVLVSVNCAAIPANLQESEFFGHEKGAFTGATQRREGRFKRADGGTIFLDEVGELPLDLQAKLLRVLQEGEFEPVGSTRTEKVDVRIITATNRDLQEMVASGRFRADLLYRLNVFPIHLPALRDRGDDIVLLAESFLKKCARRLGRIPPRLTPDGIAKLRRYDWPGNIRELQNVVERAVILSEPGSPLQLDRALPEQAPTGSHVAPGQKEGEGERILTETELRDLERDNILRALQAAGGKISGHHGAAERLGLPPNTLASRMKALRIDRPRG
jgi:transcriptional regulator with GAF, ATPase, and Fis domain